MNIGRRVNDALAGVVRFSRRRNPRYRALFDRLFAARIESIAQHLINRRRTDEGLRIAEERLLPDEERVTHEVTEQMIRFLDQTYPGGGAERAGNTKTYGVVRASFEVPADLPAELRVGIFREPAIYRAWVRFSGPGPVVTDDIDNAGILSIGIKLMDVDGAKLIDDEHRTQDFTGISSPTFTTPNVVENLKLQKRISDGTPTFYFLNPIDSHYLDAVMQGLYAKAHRSPLELTYYSCVPYLFGEGQAVKYAVRPRVRGAASAPRPEHPDYLREAMVEALSTDDVVFDFLVQFQTDPHRMPIENASVVWPEQLSPFRHVATLTIPRQRFDSTSQLRFARNLSYNPWHSIAEHRPLGNQNRARQVIYLETSKARQRINSDERIEPTGEESFDE